MRANLTSRFAFVWVVVPTVITGCYSSTSKPESSVIETHAYDAGIVNPGEVINHTFLVKNNSTSRPLIITKVRKACSCVTAKIEIGEVIPPNGQRDIQLTYDTTGRSGQTGTRLLLYTDDPSRAQILLAIRCKIRKSLEYFPGSIDFGTVVQGDGATRELTVWDAMFERLKIEEIQSDNISLQTQLAEYTGGSQDGDRDGVSGWVLTVKLPPDVPVGVIDAKLRIKTTSSLLPEIVVPIKGEVLGDLYVQPPRIAFGITGRKKKIRFTIYRRGNTTATVGDVRTDSETIRAVAQGYREPPMRDPMIVAGGSVEINENAAPVGVPVEANIYISTTSKSVPEIVVPVTYMLRGDG